MSEVASRAKDPDPDFILDVKVGQWAVIWMRAEERYLAAFRVAEVYAPNEAKDYCGHPHSAPYQRVALEGCALVPTSSSSGGEMKIFDTKAEANLFVVEATLEKLKADLRAEKDAHRATRMKVYELGRILKSF
jgi:hypothetical protein